MAHVYPHFESFLQAFRCFRTRTQSVGRYSYSTGLGFTIPGTMMNPQPCSILPSEFLRYVAYPLMVVATVWFKAYSDDDELATQKCDCDETESRLVTQDG